MAGWIPEEKLEEIRAASDIVEVVQRYVPLRRRGAGYVALCPFHEEKTPSFHVNPVRQIFHCFGCHKGGDVFRFVQEYERVSFVEAVARLAERAGIPLEWEGDVQAVRQAQTLKERMRRAHADLAQHWHRLLLRDAAAAGAREYLRRRGLVEAVVKRFQIGYAPPGWEETLRWGAARGYDPEFLEQAGLAKRRASGEGSYSFFRNRLVFPICDEQGRVVGFSARALAPEDEERKYINTPETPIFQKGKIIFGLDKARKALLDRGFAVVCEGQMDLIACHAAGVENAVAPMGTALTADHCRILKRYVSEAVLCFDADAAGRKAALRAVDDLLAEGFAVRVAVLPAPHDPDSFIREVGAEAFRERIDRARGFFDWLLDWQCAEEDVSTERGCRAVVETMAEAAWKSADPVTVESCARKTAARLGLSAETVWAVFRRRRAERRRRERPYEPDRTEKPSAAEAEPYEPPPALEQWLLRLLLQDDHLLPWAAEHIPAEWIEHPAARRVVEALYRRIEEDGEIAPALLLGEFSDEASRRVITEAAASPVEGQDLSRVLVDLAARLELRAIERALREKRRRLAAPETSGEERLEILAQTQNLLKRRAELVGSGGKRTELE